MAHNNQRPDMQNEAEAGQNELHNAPLSQQMQEQIRAMIYTAINIQGRSILNSLVHPTNEQVVDERIEDRYRNNTEELDRIPDVVRCLREFSGNQTEFSSWKKNVERILSIYDGIRGKPKYYGILNVIRNKITGHADQVLESYNTPLNWQAIAKCLTMHYADKRDISTLEYQMTTLIQGNNPIEEFYQKVYENLSLILNKISCSEFGLEATTLLTQTYRNKALDTFIRGLNGDLPRLLAMREPTDLPQALQLCLKLENQKFRSFHANNAFKSNHIPPMLPPRNGANRTQVQQQHFRQHQHNQQPFYPQLAHMPTFNQQLNRNPHFQPIAPPRPQRQAPNNTVEPMDVDQTLQTRRVDYVNRNARNNVNNIKRAASSSNMVPRKQHRSYHLNIPTTNNCTDCEANNATETNFNDIHFLD